MVIRTIVASAFSIYEGLKRIEHVHKDDTVWAFDVERDEWRLARVLETVEREFLGLLVTFSVAGEELQATDKHPMYVVEGVGLDDRHHNKQVPEMPPNPAIPGRWLAACDLQVGDVMLLKPDRRERVTAVKLEPRSLTVYNFEVEDLHTYAIGIEGVLVHNNPLDCLVGNLKAAIDRGMRTISGANAPREVEKVLEEMGRPMSLTQIGDAIHDAKSKMNIGAAEDVIFDYSGGMWDSRTGEFIGKIWERL